MIVRDIADLCLFIGNAIHDKACGKKESTTMAVRPAEPTFTELFTPKLVTILREGYGLLDLRARCRRGTDRRHVALPLSMAIVIAPA